MNREMTQGEQEYRWLLEHAQDMYTKLAPETHSRYVARTNQLAGRWEVYDQESGRSACLPLTLTLKNVLDICYYLNRGDTGLLLPEQARHLGLTPREA